MDTKKKSGLQLYSLGIVTEDKAEDEDMIKVSPIEEFSMEKGKLKEDDRKHKTSLPDKEGVIIQAKSEGGAVLDAKWIPYGNSNRDTAPDVYKNETVLIFRFADTDEYYWDTVFREPSIRRLEKVKYVYSNQPAGLVPYGDDTSYWLLWDTRNKVVRLHTSDNDGEATTYDITIDTKYGELIIEDGMNNKIHLQSVPGILDIEIENEINLKTKRFSLIADEKIGLETSTITTDADNSILNASSHTDNTPVTMKEGLTIEAGGSGNGASVKGNFQVDGNISATGSIIDSGGNTPNHSH